MSEYRLEVKIKKQLRSFMLEASFETGRGCLGILGPSGCGKSMTLKSVAGIVCPDSGRICLADDETHSGQVLYDSQQKVNLSPQKRRVGYLFQNYALFPNMTVEQNIAVGLKRHGGSRRVVSEMISRFRLDGLEKQYPGRLSGGQQQRVAFARMLAYEPNVMLLDEPFSAMDTHLKERLRLELIQVIREYHGVSVMVTHDRDEAYQLCDRLLLMDEGKVIRSGRTSEVFEDPATTTAARLTGCKNISRVERLGDYKVRALDWGGLELATAGRVDEHVTSIGIRAHDFVPLSDAKSRAYEGRADANLIPVEHPEVSEMPFEWYVMLANGIWWKTEKDIHVHDGTGVVPPWLRIAPSAILLLRDKVGE